MALQVQTTKDAASSVMQQPFTCKAPVVSLDEFGQEILDCCEGHHIYDVSLCAISLQIIVDGNILEEKCSSRSSQRYCIPAALAIFYLCVCQCACTISHVVFEWACM